jgi:hypothetical protein
MELMYEKYRRQAESLLQKINAKGIVLTVTGDNALRIQGAPTPEQLATIRLWKSSLIEVLSPKCSECKYPMTLINSGTLWFCPMGCESRSNNGN